MWQYAQPAGSIEPKAIKLWAWDQFRDLSATLQKVGRRNPYTPTWISTGTQPALGNGTLLGEFVEIGQWLVVAVRLLIGSTTTFGTGTYKFGVPRAVVNELPNWYGSATFYDSSVPVFNLGVPFMVIGEQDKVSFAVHGAAAGVTPTVPFTWAVNDILQFTIGYPVD